MSTDREGDDKAVGFYTKIVKPTIVESRQRPDDMRLAILACLVLSHMAEHYYQARIQTVVGSVSAQAFRETLRNENGAFRLIADIADAAKHVKRGRDGRLGYDNIGAQPIDISNLRAGWPINGTQVMAEDGSNLWLLSQLVTVADKMWQTKLGRPVTD